MRTDGFQEWTGGGFHSGLQLLINFPDSSSNPFTVLSHNEKEE